MCARTLTEVGKTMQLGNVFLSAFADAGAATEMAKVGQSAETKDVAGIGDAAWATEQQSDKAKSYQLRVRKGRALLTFGMTQSDHDQTLPCTMDQLTELAKLVVQRLP